MVWQRRNMSFCLGLQLEGWKIEGLPERLNQDDSVSYRFEYAGDYQFDKSQTFGIFCRGNKINLMQSSSKNAVYFPGDLRLSGTDEGWIKECKDAAVIYTDDRCPGG
jgi:hypothetical protein